MPVALAHPRSRGEHAWASDGISNGVGSSPLARGARTHQEEPGAVRRLIPARAGSTVRPPSRRRCSWAHPRSRGEHVVSQTVTVPSGGASPLARGARDRPGTPRPARGLIPARAGSTARTAPASTIRRAHPRSRGEHHEHRVAHLLTAGSSPLARGAHLLTSNATSNRCPRPSLDVRRRARLWFLARRRVRAVALLDDVAVRPPTACVAPVLAPRHGSFLFVVW